MIKPDNILEIGTYTGYSAISMAFAIDNNSKIYTIDNNDEIEDFTRTYFKKAGVENKIEFLIGDAIKIIPQMDINFDIVFIDGNKHQYSEYYDLVFDKVVKGGYIIADNALWSGKVVEDNIKNNDYDTKGIIKFNEKIQNDNRVENVLFPVRDGLMVIRKKK
jgi:predicted O-methyltransferase YrrM